MRQLSPLELRAWLDDAARVPPVLLDVREEWELERCRIDGATWIPMRDVPRRLEELNPKAEVVVICNLDKYIKLYGKIEGNLKWKEYFNKKSETSAFRKEFWISKGLNEDDAKEKVRFISDNSSLEYFRRICNSEEEALESFITCIKNKTVNFNGASKDSLNYFNTLYKILLKNNIKESDIFFGIEGKTEWFINYHKGYYLYDFTLKSKKLIIEYHGSFWHPREKDFSNLECKKSWNSIKNENSIEFKYEKDQHKKHVAIDNGFKYLEIWSDDSEEINWVKIYSFLEKNLKIKLKKEN